MQLRLSTCQSIVAALSSCLSRETQKDLLERFPLWRKLPHPKAVLDQTGIHHMDLFVGRVYIKEYL